MIHFKTIFALRSGADDLKHSLLARSPGVGQCILIVFILTVLYMAIRPCDCPTINVPFERVDAQVESTALAARARDREHPVLEEERDAPIQEISNASAQL